VVLAASENDAATVRKISPQARVSVYPNSIPPLEMPKAAEESCIVFSGNFEYHPNIDAVRFLTCEIWPQVRRRYPELRLHLVGRGDRFIRHLLPPGSSVHATGPVEDAIPEIARARLVVAPLRAGSGTRIKILQAWAAARAVVATPLAAEGLDAREGVNIALASDATAFINAIDRLLCNSAVRRTLATGGRRTFESGYTWEAAWNYLKFDPQLMRLLWT